MYVFQQLTIHHLEYVARCFPPRFAVNNNPCDYSHKDLWLFIEETLK